MARYPGVLLAIVGRTQIPATTTTLRIFFPPPAQGQPEYRGVPEALFSSTGGSPLFRQFFGRVNAANAAGSQWQARFSDARFGTGAAGPHLRDPEDYGFVLRIGDRTEFFPVDPADTAEPYQLRITDDQFQWLRDRARTGFAPDMAMVAPALFFPQYELDAKPWNRAFIDTDDLPETPPPDERAVLHAESVDFLDREWRLWSGDEDVAFGDRLYAGGGRYRSPSAEESEALGDRARVRGIAILVTPEQKRAACASIDGGGLLGDRVELNEWWKDAATGLWVRSKNRRVGRIVLYQFTDPVLEMVVDTGHPQREVSQWRLDEASQQYERPTTADAFRRAAESSVPHPVEVPPSTRTGPPIFQGPEGPFTAEGGTTPVYQRPAGDDRLDYVRLDRYTTIDGNPVAEDEGIDYRVSTDDFSAILPVSLGRRPGAAANADAAYLGFRARRRGVHVLRVTTTKTTAEGAVQTESRVWRVTIADPLPRTFDRLNALFSEDAFRSPNIATGGGSYTFDLSALASPAFDKDRTLAANAVAVRVISVTGSGESGYPAASKFTSLPVIDNSPDSGQLPATVAAESDSARTFEASALVGIRNTSGDMREDTALFVWEQGYVRPAPTPTPEAPTGPLGPTVPTEPEPEPMPEPEPEQPTPPPTPPPMPTNQAPTIATRLPALTIRGFGQTAEIDRAKRYFNDDAGYRNLTLYSPGRSGTGATITFDNSGEGKITARNDRPDSESGPRNNIQVRARDAGGLISPNNRLIVNLRAAATTPPPTPPPARSRVNRYLVVVVGVSRDISGSFGSPDVTSGIQFFRNFSATPISGGLRLLADTTGLHEFTVDVGTDKTARYRVYALSRITSGNTLTLSAVNALLAERASDVLLVTPHSGVEYSSTTRMVRYLSSDQAVEGALNIHTRGTGRPFGGAYKITG